MKPVLEFIMTEFNSERAKEHMATRLEQIAKEIRIGQRKVLEMTLNKESESMYDGPARAGDRFVLSLRFSITENCEDVFSYPGNKSKQPMLH